MRGPLQTTRRQCLALLVALLVGAGTARADEEPLYVGVATMLPDGTIRINLAPAVGNPPVPVDDDLVVDL